MSSPVYTSVYSESIVPSELSVASFILPVVQTFERAEVNVGLFIRSVHVFPIWNPLNPPL